MSLEAFLAWVLTSGGAAVVSYVLMTQLEKIPEFNPSAELKRYLSFVFAMLIAAGAFALTVELGYAEEPAGAQAWIEQLFLVMTTAIGLQQVIHARRDLSKR